MTYDPDVEQLCESIFKLAEGAPEDEYDFVSSLTQTIERYGTDDEQPEDFVTSQLVFSMLNLVVRHGTEEERALAEKCCTEFLYHLCGYTYTEASE